MSPQVVLSLALHNHQPVGNFSEVFERAYRQSYLPMVEALERHPGIPMGLHYSGCLLDWLEDAHPEFFSRLQLLVARGQVELLSGGYYEPILAIIPDRDRQGQIKKLTQYLHRRFGATARGLWLAERIWEPHLAKPIAQSGIEYTIVDDAHFFAVGLREEELRGYFVTEDEGFPLKVFPSRRRLRYLIPWQSPAEVLAYLRRFQGTSTVLLMGDDGEKFGLWPGTFAHCWERGWVDAFFSAIETEEAWLKVVPPGHAAATLPPAGRVYLPTASYDEMTEWALPPERTAEFVQAKERLEAAHDPAAAYLRGGFWRHFLVKYPEINTMHKKMLRVSAKVWALPSGRRRQRALDELWQGQCNCPYWHGVFGGVYLPHIRAANYAHLIAADTLAEPRGNAVRGAMGDFDSDSVEEGELVSRSMALTIDPGDGGTVVEWDWRDRRVNLVNVLTRRPEAYHRQLHDASAQPEHASDGSVETIHSPRVKVKESGLDRLLLYDWYRRASFIDHVLAPETTLDAFYRCRYGEAGDFVDQPYLPTVRSSRDTVSLALVRDGHVWTAGQWRSMRIEKQYTLFRRAAQLTVAYRISTSEGQSLSLTFGIETNWALTDPDAAITFSRETGTGRQIRAVPDVGRFVLGEARWGGSVDVTLSAPATVWHFPLEAVSNSEAGFERTFQGVTVMCKWPLHLRPGQAWDATVVVTAPSS